MNRFVSDRLFQDRSAPSLSRHSPRDCRKFACSPNIPPPSSPCPRQQGQRLRIKTRFSRVIFWIFKRSTYTVIMSLTDIVEQRCEFCTFVLGRLTQFGYFVHAHTVHKMAPLSLRIYSGRNYCLIEYNIVKIVFFSLSSVYQPFLD